MCSVVLVALFGPIDEMFVVISYNAVLVPLVVGCQLLFVANPIGSPVSELLVRVLTSVCSSFCSSFCVVVALGFPLPCTLMSCSSYYVVFPLLAKCA